MEQIQIVVRLLQENKVYQIMVDLDSKFSDLVRDLKDFGPYPELSLSIDQQSIDHERTFRESGILNGQVIDATRSYIGGGGPIGFKTFQFNKLEDKKILGFSSSAPKWRRVTKGLNLTGKCSNSKCEANTKQVIIQKGFGKFNMAEEQDNARCCICDQIINDTTNIIFYYCKWNIKGKIEGRQIIFDDKSTDLNGCITFEQGDDAQWLYLTITTTEI